MITIEKMMIHGLDTSRNIIVCSDVCAKLEEAWLTILENKMIKAFTSNQKKNGVFQKNSEVKTMIEAYRAHACAFELMGKELATYIFEKKCQYAQYEASTLLLAEVVYEECRYLIGLDNVHQKALTHLVTQKEKHMEVNIALCDTIISASLLKQEHAFMVELGNMRVSSVESKGEVNGQKCYLYHDLILLGEAATSYHDALKTMNKACEEVIKDYDLDAVKVLPKMKQAIKEQVEEQETLQAKAIAQAVFQEPLAQQRFVQEIKDQGIKESIPIEHHKVSKAEKVQKIRTDKGIELIIPLDYMNSTEYVEFHTAEDGSISIQLKNINRIISK